MLHCSDPLKSASVVPFGFVVLIVPLRCSSLRLVLQQISPCRFVSLVYVCFVLVRFVVSLRCSVLLYLAQYWSILLRFAAFRVVSHLFVTFRSFAASGYMFANFAQACASLLCSQSHLSWRCFARLMCSFRMVWQESSLFCFAFTGKTLRYLLPLVLISFALISFVLLTLLSSAASCLPLLHLASFCIICFRFAMFFCTLHQYATSCYILLQVVSFCFVPFIGSFCSVSLDIGLCLLCFAAYGSVLPYFT